MHACLAFERHGLVTLRLAGIMPDLDKGFGFGLGSLLLPPNPALGQNMIAIARDSRDPG